MLTSRVHSTAHGESLQEAGAHAWLGRISASAPSVIFLSPAVKLASESVSALIKVETSIKLWVYLYYRLLNVKNSHRNL